MRTKIRTAIIPIAGMGTRFLPLSKVLPKELFPLVDKPILQYIIEEAVSSGIERIVFVVKPERTKTLDYFKKEKSPKQFLKGKKNVLREVKKLNNILERVSFSFVYQKHPLGDGHAVLMAEKEVKNKSCAVLFCDDVIESKTPCLSQLIKVYLKYKNPVLALYKVPNERIPFYGIVKAKKEKGNAYQIKEIKEKPKISAAPSNLAIVGKYIITPKVFDFLKKSFLAKGEIRLSGTFGQMIKEGCRIDGCKIEGKWLECGDKISYLKSNLYLSLKHPNFGKELKRFLKERPR